MTEIISSFGGYIAGAGAIIIAILAAWFGGKSKGTIETQAKSDVKAANIETQQAQQLTEKTQETIRVVKDVDQDNQSLSDDAARQRMRTSKYHSDD
ncbi:hypothetical protein [Phytobacter diazotrophicus]|uniref:hypothetical protein n=1 Tax=Phytobacter diazotrophicus TaxID=395631 RepID=UPI002FFD1A9D